MKTIITIFLLVIIGLIALFQFTLMRHKELLQDICSLKIPALVEATESPNENLSVDKKSFYRCIATEALKKTFKGKEYCQTITLPVCDIQENDNLLCGGMIRQGRWTKAELECPLSFACPEALDDYYSLKERCK